MAGGKSAHVHATPRGWTAETGVLQAGVPVTHQIPDFDPDDLTFGPRSDPTRVSPIQERYATDIRKVLRDLRGAIRTGVEELDVFGLRSDAANAAARAVAPARPRVGARSAIVQISPPRNFPFDTDPELVDAFDNWLAKQYTRGVLEGVGHDSYVRASYKRGVDHADHALTKAGVISDPDAVEGLFNVPIHRDQLKIARTRTLDAVETVGRDMRTQVRRQLADGLAQGQNPRQIAGLINDRVDKVARHRLEMVARTETAYAQSEATLTRFKQHGVDEVGVVAEWTTAGDGRVCDLCIGLDGERFTIKEARGLLPRHPNCRCAWVPVPAQDQPDQDFDSHIDSLVENPDLDDATTADQIGQALKRELPDQVEFVGLDSLAPGQASRVAKTVKRLEDRDQISRSPVTRIGSRDDPQADWLGRAEFDHITGESRLDFNAAHLNERKVTQFMDENWLVGDPSDLDNPLDAVVAHETGHARHYQQVLDMTDQDPERAGSKLRTINSYEPDAVERPLIQDEVSEYASTKATETVAEVYAKRAMGRGDEIGQFVDDFYDSFDGPDTGAIEGIFNARLLRARMASDSEPEPSEQAESVDDIMDRLDTEDMPDLLVGSLRESTRQYDNLRQYVDDQIDE